MSAVKTAATLAGALLLTLVGSTAVAAEKKSEPGTAPGTARGAELVKTGWWWAGNETPLDETVVAPPQSSPPNVPKGTLPVAAAGGEPEKLAALEFRLLGRPGSVVDSAVLVLKESAEPGASVNADGAKIVACPVTDAFWADGASASWKARPAYDCDLASAAGERDAKSGLWTFDITMVAGLWTTEGHTGSSSLVLVEAADAPESFQVAFDGPSREGLGFAFTMGAPTPMAPMPEGSGSPILGPGASGGSGSSGSSAGSSGGGFLGTTGGSDSTGSGSLTGADALPAAEGPVAAEPEDAVAAAPAETAPVAAAVAAPAWYSGIPRGGYLLLPLALGLAFLMMLALGPDAQPATGPKKNGVGRALERLRAGHAALTSKGKN